MYIFFELPIRLDDLKLFENYFCVADLFRKLGCVAYPKTTVDSQITKNNGCKCVIAHNNTRSDVTYALLFQFVSIIFIINFHLI